MSLIKSLISKILIVHSISYQYIQNESLVLFKKLLKKRSPVVSAVLKNPSRKLIVKTSFKFLAIFLIPVVILLLAYNKVSEIKSNPNYYFRTRIEISTKSIIFFGPIDWGYRKQRPQHLAISLAKKGIDVFYINPTIVYHSKHQNRLHFQTLEGVKVVSIHSNHFKRNTYIGVYPILKDSGRDFARLIEHMLSIHANFSSTIVIQQPGWWNLVRHLVGNQVVFDCMDLHIGFDLISSDTELFESEMDMTVDQIIVSSGYLQEIKRDNKPGKIVCIRNGVDLSHFQFIEDYVSDENVVVGYFGALAEWFDVDLVAFLAASNPNLRFEIIGLISDDRIARVLSSYSNIFLIGELPNSELPARIKHWRVGLIPFKLTPLILATNPVKMYEYAASGIPILATEIPEVLSVANVCTGIYIGGTYEIFQENLKSALSLNSKERKQLSEWAMAHSWESRSNDLLKSIQVKPKVSVVILMWNQGLMTLRCLKSVHERSDYDNLEVILVDNGSDDVESRIVQDWIEKSGFNQIVYVKNVENMGFAAGNNVGLRIASGEYIVILNNDTEVTPGWIWRSMKHFAINPKLGLLGPSTNNCGNEARVTLQAHEEDWLEEVVPRFGLRELEAVPVEMLAFFCVIMPRAVLEKVGEMGQEYGLGYFEDDDYCKRVLEAGFEIAIARDIFVYHKQSASFDLLGDTTKAELFNANRIIYESKWGSWVPPSYSNDRDNRRFVAPQFFPRRLKR